MGEKEFIGQRISRPYQSVPFDNAIDLKWELKFNGKPEFINGDYLELEGWDYKGQIELSANLELIDKDIRTHCGLPPDSLISGCILWKPLKGSYSLLGGGTDPVEISTKSSVLTCMPKLSLIHI